MLSVAEAWLILSLTNSPLLLGLINMLHWGPILLLAVPSGAIAERWSVSTAFFVWGAGGLATLALLTAARHRANRSISSPRIAAG